MIEFNELIRALERSKQRQAVTATEDPPTSRTRSPGDRDAPDEQSAEIPIEDLVSE